MRRKVSLSKNSCHSLDTVVNKDAQGNPRSMMVSLGRYRGMIHCRIRRRISRGNDLQEDAMMSDVVCADGTSFCVYGGSSALMCSFLIIQFPRNSTLPEGNCKCIHCGLKPAVHLE